MEIRTAFALVLSLATLACTSQLDVVEEGSDTNASSSSSKLFTLKNCETSPKNEELVANEIVKGFALHGELIFYGTRAGVFSVPKDLSAQPKMLSATQTDALAIAGETLYFCGDGFMNDSTIKKLPLQGGTETAVVVDGRPARAAYLVSADDAVYAAGGDLYGEERLGLVYVLAADGGARGIAVMRNNGVATNGSDAFVTASASRGVDVYRVAKGSASAELLIAQADIDVPFKNQDFVASEQFLYATAANGERKRTLKRAPIGGGTFEAVSETRELTTLLVDGHDLYIAAGGVGQCANRYDEATNTVEALHNPAWRVVGLDEKHIYYASDTRLVRLPRN